MRLVYARLTSGELYVSGGHAGHVEERCGEDQGLAKAGGRAHVRGG